MSSVVEDLHLQMLQRHLPFEPSELRSPNDERRIALLDLRACGPDEARLVDNRDALKADRLVCPGAVEPRRAEPWLSWELAPRGDLREVHVVGHLPPAPRLRLRRHKLAGRLVLLVGYGWKFTRWPLGPRRPGLANRPRITSRPLLSWRALFGDGAVAGDQGGGGGDEEAEQTHGTTMADASGRAQSNAVEPPTIGVSAANPHRSGPRTRSPLRPQGRPRPLPSGRRATNSRPRGRGAAPSRKGG